MLTPKHRQFVAEYLVDLNATKAARRCGYSAKTAKQQGARLLTNVDVRAAIQRGQARKLDKVDLTADRVLEELARVAFGNLQDLVTATGADIPLHQLPRAVAAALASREVVMKNAAAGDDKIDRVLKVKMVDKVPALGLLARHFALLVDRVQVTGEVSLGEKIAAARARGAALRAARTGGKKG